MSAMSDLDITVREDVDRWHRTYQSGMITLGELAEELTRLDQRYGAQPVTREALDDARVRCTCARNNDGTFITFLCPVHADTDPCLTMAQVTGRRRAGTIRRGVCTACGHQSGGRP